MINLNTKNLGGQSSMVMAPAYAYGGFVQLLAGMWEIVLGNGRSEVSQMMFETM